MALTAGKLARQYNISRTALLYYDQIGLVTPTGRSPSGYRLYSEADRQRLENLIAYRDAGITLEEIAKLLTGAGNTLETILLKRLNELNDEIIAAKARQAAIIGIIRSIKKDDAGDAKRVWHEALEEAGISGSAAQRLHFNFEEHSPQMHESFLKALGFDEDETKMIRDYYKQG